MKDLSEVDVVAMCYGDFLQCIGVAANLHGCSVKYDLNSKQLCVAIPLSIFVNKCSNF